MAEIDTIPDGQLDLKKRARRRLVGAVALALAAIIVLPMVMDQEPKPLTQDIQVRIPSQDAPRLSPAKPPDAKAGAAPAAATAPAQARAPADSAKPASTTEPKAPADLAKQAGTAATKEAKPGAQTAAVTPASAAADAKPEPAPAGAPAAKDGQKDGPWVLQLGAYQDQANVKQLQARLKALGYPTYTEKVETAQGLRTRVRGGPFATRQAAEHAQARLKKVGAGAPVGGVLAQKQ